MTDPFSIIASTLTVVDATRSVIAACSEYLKHAKSAPEELRLLVEDLEDLNITITRLDEIAKSRWTLDQSPNQEFKEWKVPLERLVNYTKQIKGIVDKQDLKQGVFHELLFRAVWPSAWKYIQSLLTKIEKEKNKLHFATAIEGVGMVRKVYMLVEDRLPVRPIEHFEKAPITWRRLDKNEQLAYFLSNLGPYLYWGGATYDFPRLENPHQHYIEACAEHSCDIFLTSPAYLGWRDRKTPGPSLLSLTGSAGSGKSILCGQISENLRKSNPNDVGIAYVHFEPGGNVRQILQFCIMQLAFQSQCIPEHLVTYGPDTELVNSISSEENLSRADLLKASLISILPKFRRTYILIDGDTHQWEDPGELSSLSRQLLEQDLANVSLALFQTSSTGLDPDLELADVSIRLLKVEYRAKDITRYVDLKLTKLLLPEMKAAKNLRMNFDGGIDIQRDVRNAIVSASDNMYLAADIFIDSLIKIIRYNPTREEFFAHLRQMREGSEIMMQRDPDIMKQKQMTDHLPVRRANQVQVSLRPVSRERNF